MAYILSGINTFTPISPTRVGLVWWVTDFDDGSHVEIGAWINGPYSDAPDIDADSTARGTGTDGVYTGLTSTSIAMYDQTRDMIDADVWAPVVETFAGGSPYSMADVATIATTDSTILAAVASALSGQPAGDYVVSIADDQAGALSLTAGDPPTTVTLSCEDGDGNPNTTTLAPFAWDTDDHSIATVAAAMDGFSADVTPVGVGSCNLLITGASLGAPGLNHSLTIGVSP